MTTTTQTIKKSDSNDDHMIKTLIVIIRKFNRNDSHVNILTRRSTASIQDDQASFLRLSTKAIDQDEQLKKSVATNDQDNQLQWPIKKLN